ncbi:hypothetical protein NW762_006552 [Fusarium torreyae]|uniref:Uncharacterized protein n=1 Tax=Fusarium torreyae TaxID=1237075 RepID=A0A9W8VHA4_9HYPO|nr:hypothetical protein NW762_006552 [Fusarium torreyae]
MRLRETGNSLEEVKRRIREEAALPAVIAAPAPPAGPVRNCVGCGSNTHNLIRCLKVGPDGLMAGRPKCNTLDHGVAQRPRLLANIALMRRMLVDGRGNMPAFQSAYSSVSIVRASMVSGAKPLKRLPWTPAFANLLTDAIPQIQEDMDRLGLSVIGGYKLPVEPLTKNWPHVDAFFSRPFSDMAAVTEEQLAAQREVKIDNRKRREEAAAQHAAKVLKTINDDWQADWESGEFEEMPLNGDGSDVDMGECDDEQWTSMDIDHSTPIRDLLYVCVAVEGSSVYMSVGHGVFPSIPMSGFDHIHVISKNFSKRKVYDTTLGQVAHVPLVHSAPERLEQLSWAFHSDTPVQSVTVYRDGPQKEKAWVRLEHRLRRQEVWNAHLGGFMSIVSSMGDWGLDAAMVARCFLSEGLMATYLAIASRLQNYGILKPHDDSRLTMNLQGKELEVFKATLPILNFDHRLAYLVAQHTDTPVVRQTKLQLASLLSVSLLDMFDFGTSLLNPEGSSDDATTIVAACEGYSKPMANQGAMWVAIGLWKSVAKELNDFSMLSVGSGTRYPVPGLVKVEIKLSSALEASHKLRALESTIDSLKIPTFTKHSNEEVPMGEYECYEIQTHLFSAYLHQLALGAPKSTGIYAWKDVSSKSTISGLHCRMKAFFDAEKLRTQDQDPPPCMYGVYHDLYRPRDGHCFFWDWTGIPTLVFRKWYKENNHGGRIGIASMIKLVGGYGPNYDDHIKNWKAEDEY